MDPRRSCPAPWARRLTGIRAGVNTHIAVLGHPDVLHVYPGQVREQDLDQIRVTRS
jgi:hypothetical protein